MAKDITEFLGSEQINYILDDFAAAKQQAIAKRSEWELLQKNITANSDDYFGYTNMALGYKKTNLAKLVSSVPSILVNNLVANLYFLLVDPKTEHLDLEIDKYFTISLGGNPKKDIQPITVALGEFEGLRKWLTECRRLILRQLADPATNFYSAAHELLYNIVVIGVGCFESPKTTDGHIKCMSVPMSEIYIGTSGYGDINRVFRVLRLTNREAADRWGQKVLEGLPRTAANPLQDQAETEYLEYTAAVPQEYIKKSGAMAPYISLIIRTFDKKIISYTLHTSFPYNIPRYKVINGDIYGSSICYDAFANIQRVNKLAEQLIKNGDWMVNPPILVKNVNSLPFRQILPGKLVQGLNEMGQAEVSVFQGLGGNGQVLLQFYQQTIQELQQQLSIGYAMLGVTQQVTAREVAQRSGEENIKIFPIISRIESEWLSPFVKRLFRLYTELGKLPGFPYAELAEFVNNTYYNILPSLGIDEVNAEMMQVLIPDPLVLFNVHFSGNAARMQKSQEVQLRLQVLQFAMQAMQQDPTVAYKVDLVEMLNSIIEDYSISLRGFRSDQEASRLAKQAEEARAAQQQQIMQNIAQQQAETQEILAKTAKIRSEI